MKTCPALPSPKNGHMVCTTDDFSYPTVCRFTCQAGYQLLGSRKRSCLAIALWTGIATRCRGKRRSDAVLLIFADDNDDEDGEGNSDDVNNCHN